ncbi:hypothetical protein C1H76_1967 [Elsinoe australis]|uniref:Uncharacterized protein n=1 Tax=Elsinoe australis TaxID=40998 RepID=A0A4U7B7Z5_9PEZI|nr:hypothetical protein C1H76_1967 [Elsinoe australis]
MALSISLKMSCKPIWTVRFPYKPNVWKNGVRSSLSWRRTSDAGTSFGGAEGHREPVRGSAASGSLSKFVES